MTMVAFIIVLLIIGFFVGLVARAVVPGRDHMGILATILLGIVGSFVGGFTDSLLQYHALAFHPSGIIWSIVGSILLLLLLRVTGLEPGRSGRRRW
jgi:uncharacterized membrane protein YeaQ/YmgE (transglycosylase-associated protein family)